MKSTRTLQVPSLTPLISFPISLAIELLLATHQTTVEKGEALIHRKKHVQVRFCFFFAGKLEYLNKQTFSFLSKQAAYNYFQAKHHKSSKSSFLNQLNLLLPPSALTLFFPKASTSSDSRSTPKELSSRRKAFWLTTLPFFQLITTSHVFSSRKSKSHANSRNLSAQNV